MKTKKFLYAQRNISTYMHEKTYKVQKMSLLQGLTRTKVLILIGIIVLGSVGVGFAFWEATRERLILATTTSTYDSGLLDQLVPAFQSKYHASVQIISVGTGQAIATAARGDADIILVHARTAEDKFVADGNGVHRVCVMYNDFIIVGPSSDPSTISGMTSATSALKKISQAGDQGKATFISRGDNSGTHKKEMAIWTKAGISPVGKSWYLEAGQGMGDTLRLTDQKQAYTLVDRGTWLALKSGMTLTVLTEGDQILLNPYGVISVNPDKFPNVNYQMAVNFAAFLVSKEGQNIIANFKKGGEQLFHPLYGKCASITGCPTQAEELAYWGPISGNYGTVFTPISTHHCCHH